MQIARKTRSPTPAIGARIRGGSIECGPICMGAAETSGRVQLRPPPRLHFKRRPRGLLDAPRHKGEHALHAEAALALAVLGMGLWPAPMGDVLQQSINEILRLAAPGRKLLIGM